MSKAWYSVLFLLCVVMSGFTQPAQTTQPAQVVDSGINSVPVVAWFDEANGLYKAEDYSGALTLYQKIAEAGYESADLYYNMGNSYYRTGEIGEAILYFEKALLISPADKDIQHNLNMAESHTRDRAPGGKEDDANPVLQGVLQFHYFLGVNRGLWFFASSLLLLAVSIGLRLFYSGDRDYLFIPFWALLFLVLITVGTSVAYRIYNVHFVSRGVVVNVNTDVMSGPGDQFQVLNRIHEGTRFLITDEQQNWVQLEIGETVKGWVQQNDIGKIH